MVSILLCNTIFDNENDNVLLFNNKAELREYFENLKDKVLVENVNFNVNNILSTEIYVKVPETLSFLKLLNYNYCIVTQDDDALYYFIKSSKQDSGNQIKLNLELDVINTYVYDLNSENLQALISRTHLDRFIKSGDKFKYNFENTSPLFERENVKNVSKRVTQKERLNFEIDTSGNTAFNTFINDNVVCWKYIFLNPNINYIYSNSTIKVSGKLSTLRYYNGDESNNMDSNLVVIAVPIYKNGAKKIKVSNYGETKEYVWADYASNIFLGTNNNYANVQAVKLSLMPPLYIDGYKLNSDYHFNSNKELVLYNLTQANWIYPLVDESDDPTAVTEVVRLVRTQELNVPLRLYLNNKLCDFEFFKNEITNANEPKMFNEDYSTYKLFIGGQQHELPISKTSGMPEFYYREIISPDITKGNICLKTGSVPYDNKIFDEKSQEDFTGFNYTLDLSMWYYSDKLSDYLASNKNYLQIFKNDKIQQGANMIFNVGSSIYSGDVLGAAGGLFGGAIDIAKSSRNLELTLDNMSNAPGTLNNINSDPLLIQLVSGIGLFIEKLECLPFERELIIDEFKTSGYTYNKLGNVVDFIKTRKYYNYIECLIYDFGGKFSETIKERIKAIFAKGIRFWHADAWSDITQFKIDLNLNNIERSIDNGE